MTGFFLKGYLAEAALNAPVRNQSEGSDKGSEPPDMGLQQQAMDVVHTSNQVLQMLEAVLSRMGI